MLEQLKILLGISDNSKDNLLTQILYITIEEVRTYCHRDDVENVDSLILQMCVYKYNRLGTEGLTSENFSGVSYSYSDYPSSIVSQLKAHRKVRTIG